MCPGLFYGFIQIFVHYFIEWFQTKTLSRIHSDIPLSIFSEISPRFAPRIPLEISPWILFKNSFRYFSRNIVVRVSAGISLVILQVIFQGTITGVDPFVFKIFVWKPVKKIERDLIRIFLEIGTWILLGTHPGMPSGDFCINFSSDLSSFFHGFLQTFKQKFLQAFIS